ncbi:MAG TPA: hypothetical protein VH723_00885 [Candidatus Limnocylindrales bacterium]|jgi:hypothetical protein
MPGLRTLLLSVVGGVAVGVYLQAWIGAPTFLAVGVGALMILLVLLVSASVGGDDAAAAAAWRAAAPDLASGDPGRLPFVAGGSEPGPDEPAAGSRDGDATD